MPAGRPTKLTKSVLEQAREYLDGGYLEKGNVIPSIAGMALVLNVNRATLYQWSKDYPDKFSDILEECKTLQEEVLLNQGLSGGFNAAICKLALGKHGYHERQEVTGANGGPMQTESKVLPMVGVLPDGKKVGNTG